MRDCAVVRMPQQDGLWCFYNTGEGRIVYKTFGKGKWGQEQPLLSGVRSPFTVSMDKQGKVYLFCQDIDGHMLLCSNTNNSWESKVVLENVHPHHTYTVCLHPMIADEGISLIYNMPNPEERSQYLVHQSLQENGRWSIASRIDRFVPQREQLYTLQHVTREHALLFYQTQTPENNVGYREMTPRVLGNFNGIHSTAYPIGDTSFLTTRDAVHSLIVVKSIFGSQLIYKKKETDAFSSPNVLWEAQNISHVLLFIVQNRLYATFMSNKQLFMCVSKDKGATFSRPIRYQNKFCLNPVKAAYLSYEPQHESQFYCHEVYVDANSLWDVQLLPDMYEDFYPLAEYKPEPQQEPQPMPVKKMVAAPEPVEPPVNKPASPRNKIVFDEHEMFDEKKFMMENRLSILERQNQEKEYQINILTKTVKEKQALLRQMEEDFADLQKRFQALKEAVNKPPKPLKSNPEVFIVKAAEAQEVPDTEASAEEEKNVPGEADLTEENAQPVEEDLSPEGEA